MTNAPQSRKSVGAAIAQNLRGDPLLILVTLYLVLLVLAATFAQFVTLESATRVSLGGRLTPPVWANEGSWRHVLGTDALGRDVLVRTIDGARTTLFVGSVVTLLAGAFGSLMGVIAGYFGGKVDLVIMRIVDAQFAFPNLLLVIAVIAVFGASLPVLILVLSVVSWMVFARVIRGVVMSLRNQTFVRAAQFAGCSEYTIIRKHILPGVAAPLLTQSVLEFAHIILAESALSFLGLGVQPPQSSWGLMVAESRPYMETAWWTIFFPGFALALTVLCINLFGSALRLWIDPRHQPTESIDRVATQATPEPAAV